MRHQTGIYAGFDESILLGNNVGSDRTTLKTAKADQFMNYRRALITGGAGLIGSHIADRLGRRGFPGDRRPRQL